jgi:Zn-dependent peptidase ImmA (M78 family)
MKADFFAGELLMPMEPCKRIEYECAGGNQAELSFKLIKRFDVSRSAAATRVKEMRLGIT